MTGTDARPPGRFEEIMEGVAARLLTDFKLTAALNHSGSKGSVREDRLRLDFLDKYLVGTVAVLGSSEVVAADGQVSRQSDVLIVDPSVPPLWDAEGYRVVPAEAVDAVIEVKSQLTLAELRSAWQNIASVKRLPKTAYGPEAGPIEYRTTLYGREWDTWPTLGFVFAYSSNANLESLVTEFGALARDEPDPSKRLDAVFILDRGMLLWQDPETQQVSLTPGPSTLFAVAADASPRQVLMSMVAGLNSILSQVHHKPIKLSAYLPPDYGNIAHRVLTIKTHD